MDDAVRDRLTGLVQEHGVELLQDPARLEAFLRDLCPGSKAEIYCLVAGIREGAVNELRGADPGRSPEAARDHVIQRLSRDLRFDEEAATWTVDTVIAALDAAAQDAPVSDDLDHIGYCASCHAMMSSSGDLETCSECGAALIDVRQVSRDQQGDLQAASARVDEQEVPSRHPVVAGTEDVPVAAVVAPAAVDESQSEEESSAMPPDESPPESPAVKYTPLQNGTRAGVSAAAHPSGSDERPSRGRWQTKRRAIGIAAAAALVAAVILIVVVAGDSTDPNPVRSSDAEWRSVHSINDVDYHVASGRAWAVGDGGVILTSNDAGGTWSEQDSGTTDDLVDVMAVSDIRGLAFSADGDIHTTIDGGLTWQ